MDSRTIDSALTTVLANALTHVHEVQARHWQSQMSRQEATGIFVTALRREFAHSVLGKDKTLVHNLINVRSWDAPCKPTITWYSHNWRIKIPIDDGVWNMTELHAERLCAAARAQASYASSKHDETVEINRTFADLEASLRNMKAGVTVAASINAQADQIVENLCQVAEKLTA